MTSGEQTDQIVAVTASVTDIWRRTLNIESHIPGEADFVTLGGDSLLLISILDEIEETYRLELDVEAVIADLTVDGMVRAILAASARRTTNAG